MLSHTRRKDTLSSQSSFCTILQSAVYILYLIYILYPDCTLHSSVCSLHFALTGIRGTNTVYFWLQLFAQHGRYKKKKKSASSCFQHLSAKFALFWFWSHPITKFETDIQKCLWPEPAKVLHMAKMGNIFRLKFSTMDMWVSCYEDFLQL